MRGRVHLEAIDSLQGNVEGGIGAMSYNRFISYNVIGGVAWVGIFVFLGYYFGSLEFVRNNFSFVVLAIIAISVLPIIIEYLMNRMRATRGAEA